MKFCILILVLLLSVLPLVAVVYKIGDYENPGTGDYIILEGDIAYIADGESGLQIVDIFDPQNPQFMGSYDTPDYAYSVCVVDNIAYIADGDSGLVILDVSNPHDPILMGIYNTPDFAYSVKVTDNIAYIAVGNTGLVIVDVTNPANPQFMGTCNTPDNALCVSIYNNKAYIADGHSGLQIIDISNPHQPSILGSIDSMYYANDVTVVGNVAYLTDGWYGLKIIDVSDPYSPTLINTYDSNNEITSVTVSSNRAYLNSSFEIVDLTDLHDLELLDSYDIAGGGHSRSIAISNNTAFVSTHDSQLQILNIANTDSTQFIGSYHPVDTYFTSFEVIDNTAFLIAGDFRILDISNPLNMQILSSVPTYDDFPQSVTVQGNIAYLCNDEGFKIIDISDIQNPFELGDFSPSGTQLYVTSLSVVGNIAYLTDSEWGLKTVDVSNPHNPVLMGSNSPGTGYAAAVVDTLAYLAYGYNDLVIFDVSDPYNLQSVSYFFTPPTYVKGIRVNGHYAYLYGLDSFLYIIDVADPLLPVLSSTIELHPTSTINDITIQDDLLFVCDSNWNAISIYDISNPSSPQLLKKHAWNLYTSKIYVSNGRIYTLNGYHGMNILDLNTVSNQDQIVPVKAISLSNYPNPFNPSTTISFDLPKAGIVNMDIYNIRGQKVKNLVSENYTQGYHTISWNGTNDNGHAVASGVYFARMNSNGKNMSRKLVLVK